MLVALILMMVGLVIVVAWLVWPERPKDLTLHLKFVRNEIVDGVPKLLFRVEGADKYEIMISRVYYVNAHDRGEIPLSTFLPKEKSERQFYADPPLYSGWNLQADVYVGRVDKKFSQHLSNFWWVMKKTWKDRNKTKSSMFSLAKLYWQHHRMLEFTTLSEQKIGNEPIKNHTAIQSSR